MSKTNEIATTTEQVTLENPNAILGFANQLKDLVVDNKLYTNIKGKNYVNVEGWQIAGAFMGIFPIVENVENLSDGVNYKYRAEVSLQDKEGRKVGHGVAICTNKESGKKNFDEYAVASMAQTRAVGKAFRMNIGWLLKVAGYETTPAEEMDVIEAEEANVVAKEKAEENLERVKAIAKLREAKTLKELKNAYITIGKIREDEEVIRVKNELKEQLADSEAEDE